MKKVFISLLISAPLLFTAPSFAASSPILYNPELRTDSTSVAGNSNLSKAGTNYAYRYHRHWHRWQHRGHWHRWHHYHYYRHYRW